MHVKSPLVFIQARIENPLKALFAAYRSYYRNPQLAKMQRLSNSRVPNPK